MHLRKIVPAKGHARVLLRVCPHEHRASRHEAQARGNPVLWVAMRDVRPAARRQRQHKQQRCRGVHDFVSTLPWIMTGP
jgi:hypothetical protein